MSAKSTSAIGLLAASLALVAACSSSSGGSGDNGTQSDTDSAASATVDASGDAAFDDASQASPADATADADGATGSVTNMPAGKSGVDAFCTQICNHEQSCAALLDVAPSALTGCATSCQTSNEASSANPPTELLRADYVAALGACIASSSCDVSLQTSEATCGEGILSGTGDAGGHGIAPTQAPANFCRALEASPCAADGGAQDCLSAFAFYSDVTLNAATSCFSDATCAAVESCYSAAFAQQ
ncbi:MAG: hypothetical protein ACLP1X_22245 [Polyangiaceae bacterium]